MNSVTRQKGLASSTPSPFKRWLVSRLMTFVGSEKRQQSLWKKKESKRQQQGRRHTIEYFHQVDDGYSHLAIQTLSKLKKQYDVDLNVYLVPALRDENFPEPDLLHDMSRTDARSVASYYGLTFPESDTQIENSSVQLAASILCTLDPDQFASAGVMVSDCLWKGDATGLNELAEQYGTATSEKVKSALDNGASRRAELKHYSGGMFYYEGEWYWSVDRLYHLEKRLRTLGAVKENDAPRIAPRPEIPSSFGHGASQLTLEYYPSLRSPYTAVSFPPTMKLAEDSGVNLVVRPGFTHGDARCTRYLAQSHVYLYRLRERSPGHER